MKATSWAYAGLSGNKIDSNTHYAKNARNELLSLDAWLHKGVRRLTLSGLRNLDLSFSAQKGLAFGQIHNRQIFNSYGPGVEK